MLPDALERTLWPRSNDLQYISEHSDWLLDIQYTHSTAIETSIGPNSKNGARNLNTRGYISFNEFNNELSEPGVNWHVFFHLEHLPPSSCRSWTWAISAAWFRVWRGIKQIKRLLSNSLWDCTRSLQVICYAAMIANRWLWNIAWQPTPVDMEGAFTYCTRSSCPKNKAKCQDLGIVYLHCKNCTYQRV